MKEEGNHIADLPQLKNPVLISGFEGWGNAMSISTGMADYLIKKMDAVNFAALNPDIYYRYDQSRPVVSISDGALNEVSMPGGTFYYVRSPSDGNDLVILRADEPNLKWAHFSEELLSLCGKLGVKTLITLGSMYDQVLHTDRIISGIVNRGELRNWLVSKGVNLVSYQGPSAIHTTLHSEGDKRGFECMSMWCHCPYYLQGTTHFGLLNHLASMVSSFCSLELDLKDLEDNWEKLKVQIQELVDSKPELREMIQQLRKVKIKGTSNIRNALRGDEKVINLMDFMDPKDPSSE